MSEPQFLEAETTAELIKVPATWSQPHGWPANAFLSPDNLKVVFSVDMVEGEEWLHASASREKSLPSWEDMVRVKRAFFGDNRDAVHVLPKDGEYINHCDQALHIWGRRTGRTMPDFRRDLAPGIKSL